MAKKRKKKGQMSLNQLPTAVIIFAVAVIVTAVMATVLDKIQVTQCESWNTTSNACNAVGKTVAYNISGAGLEATETFADFFDPIAVIVVAVVIIGLILGAFVLARGGRRGGV